MTLFDGDPLARLDEYFTREPRGWDEMEDREMEDREHDIIDDSPIEDGCDFDDRGWDETEDSDPYQYGYCEDRDDYPEDGF